MNLQQVLGDPPTVHRDQSGNLYSMGLMDEVLAFIHSHLDENSTTMETGCGVSTAIFALSGARHTVISPAEHELEEIRKYCSEKGISIDKVNFIVGKSQHVLPSIELPELDLLLIDGLHGFPAPY